MIWPPVAYPEEVFLIMPRYLFEACGSLRSAPLRGSAAIIAASSSQLFTESSTSRVWASRSPATELPRMGVMT
jgi:hypothetical protein